MKPMSSYSTRQCKALEALPPTSDALRGHIERAHYQTLIWRQSDNPKPDVPPSTDFGWKVDTLLPSSQHYHLCQRHVQTLSSVVAARGALH